MMNLTISASRIQPGDFLASTRYAGWRVANAVPVIDELHGHITLVTLAGHGGFLRVSQDLEVQVQRPAA